LDAYLPQCESEINGALASQYTVPFSPVPPMISDLCVDLIYIKMKIMEKSIEPLKNYYTERIKALQSGAIVLVDSSGTVTEPTGNSTYIDEQYHSAFGPDDPINWQPDSDTLEDAEDTRDDD
jgi:phage gp36-like protein